MHQIYSFVPLQVIKTRQHVFDSTCVFSYMNVSIRGLCKWKCKKRHTTFFKNVHICIYTVASFTNVPKVPRHYQYFQNLLYRNLQNMTFFLILSNMGTTKIFCEMTPLCISNRYMKWISGFWIGYLLFTHYRKATA